MIKKRERERDEVNRKKPAKWPTSFNYTDDCVSHEGLNTPRFRDCQTGF